MLICFHIRVLQEYWDLTKSRIPLKPVLGGMKIVALYFCSHEETQQNRVFCSLYCRFSLFLKDPFSSLFCFCFGMHYFVSFLVLQSS